MPPDLKISCRICRKSKNSQEIKPLSNAKLKSMVETICGIVISDDVSLICHGCVATIESSYQLRELAQITDDDEESDEEEEPKVKEEEENEDDCFQDSGDNFEEYDSEPPQPTNKGYDELIKSRKEATIKEVPCRLCRRYIKEMYLEDHEMKCKGTKVQYKCPVKSCNKRFIRKRSLINHSNSKHFQKKPFKCDLCGRNYTTKDSLRGHMVSHLSERTAECFVCGAKFKSKLSLYKHRIVHENKFVHCSICNARFKSKYECSYHERIKHLGQQVQRKNPNPSFSCDECDNVYKTKDSLKRHIIRVHKKIKDFVCFVEGCDAKYGYHCSLKKHLTKKHPEIDLTGMKFTPDPCAATEAIDTVIVTPIKVK